MLTDHYVYYHKRADNGVVFYIGSGRGKRVYSKGHTKTKDWGVVDELAGGHTVELVYTGLTKEHCEFIEEYLITNPDENWQLVNKRLPVKKHKLDFDELDRLFEYSDKSPSGLLWKGSKFKSVNGRKAGSLQSAGGGKKYWTVRVGNRLFLAHRVIFRLVVGDIPDNMVVDHIDGNGLNNSVSNLRLLSQRENSTFAMSSAGRSGHKYIHLSSEYATFSIKNMFGTRVRKFNISKYGKDEAIRMAVEARDSFLKDVGEM